MKSAELDVLGLKFGAINTSSGGCDSESETEMLDILKSAGVTNCKTWYGEFSPLSVSLVSEEMSDPEQALEAAAIDLENAAELLGVRNRGSLWKMA